MKLIAERLSKNDKQDRLRYVRANGSETISPMPRQGILPHDLVHFVVESTLPLRHGFLGLVAEGAEAAFVMQAVHDKAYPDVETEAVQAEAVVEALQSQLWNGGFDRAMFDEGVRGACAARGKPAIDLAGVDPERDLFEKALALDARWKAVGWFQNLSLEFRPRT
jgi:hypothetical protein